MPSMDTNNNAHFHVPPPGKSQLLLLGGGSRAGIISSDCKQNQLHQNTFSNTKNYKYVKLKTRNSSDKVQCSEEGMPKVRLFRVQRKHLFYFIVILITLIIYIQFLAYELLEAQPSKNSNKHKCSTIQPIDVVYTWVNGSEPRFKKELKHYAEKYNSKQESYTVQRFDDKEELKFSLRSIEKYMPWIRHIYIVTNGQIPSWLNLDHAGVTIVTHDEIFSNSNDLPTFSSPAIEANLHRIPGLSKRFIYFNDDVFLNDYVYPEDFYTISNGYNIYTAWLTQDCAIGCRWEMLNNGKCNPTCYNQDCNYDINDCKLHEHEATTESVNLMVTPTLIPRATSLNESVSRYNNEKIKYSKFKRQLARQYKIIKVGPNQYKENINITTNTTQKLNKDLFSLSLRYTQFLLGRKFGYKNRRVIAHAPIMFDRDIMQELQLKFAEEFELTQRNHFRHETNVQIAYMYSYYLSSAKIVKNMSEIFDEFDTDHSGTWSDREIRTLLTRIYSLPITYQNSNDFENVILNCTSRLSEKEYAQEQMHVTPLYERYVDSSFSVITKRIIVECPCIKRYLELYDAVSLKPKYKYKFVNSSDYVHFQMLHSYLAYAMHSMDTIRKFPKKFVCMNDDLDRNDNSRNDDTLVITLLIDFFLSLFPKPSRYELSPAFRNRFARMDELRAWKERKWYWKLLWHDEAISPAIAIFYIILVSIVIYVLYYLMSMQTLRFIRWKTM